MGLHNISADIQQAWQSYTPSWTSTGTQPVLNNGSLTGSYIELGKLVVARFILIMGSTTTFGTGSYSISLPFAEDLTYSYASGNANAFDANTSSLYAGHWRALAFTTLAAPVGYYSDTVPFTWAVDDALLGIISYQVA